MSPLCTLRPFLLRRDHDYMQRLQQSQTEAQLAASVANIIDLLELNEVRPVARATTMCLTPVLAGRGVVVPC